MSKKKFLIFDFETTGVLSKENRNADPMKNPEVYPHAIQLAFSIIEEGGNMIETYDELIKPDGWEIPTDQFWIDNGYKTETNEKLGVPMPDAINAFIKALNQVDYVVAHNLNFDYPLMIAEMNRYQIGFNGEITNKPKKLCTMQASFHFVGAKHSEENVAKWPFLKNKLKFPKLEELHEKLFDRNFDNAHDASADIKATGDCMFELINRGILDIDSFTYDPKFKGD